MYYSPTDSSTVTGIVTTPAQQFASQISKMTKDLAYTTTFGLHRVAYEGGLSLDPGGNADTSSALATKLAALADPRLQQLVVTNHNQWTNAGGDLLVYYLASDQYKFAFTDEYFNTNTPKLNALDQLAAEQATQNFSVGTALSASQAVSIQGAQFSLTDKSSGAFAGALGLAAGNWTSYLINIPVGGDYVINASYKTYGTAVSFKLLLGGAVIGDYSGLLSDSKYASTGGILLTLPAGITSLRFLMGNASANLSLASVSFDPIPVASPGGVPEPAAGAAVLTLVPLLRRRRR